MWRERHAHEVLPKFVVVVVQLVPRAKSVAVIGDAPPGQTLFIHEVVSRQFAKVHHREVFL